MIHTLVTLGVYCVDSIEAFETTTEVRRSVAYTYTDPVPAGLPAPRVSCH